MKTYEEINERIGKREAVVVTAEEMTDIVRERGAREAARRVDVVTTGTFGPMCSSGVFLNTGHTTPRMKMTEATLNGVPAYCGIAAVDLYLGATEIRRGDPANESFPGEFEYGGGHVIEDLVRGREVRLEARAYGTDCYPRRGLDTALRLEDLNDAILFNPRNAYQNYNVAVNARSDRPIYTYLGILRPGMENAGYCSAGSLSPLLNDPHYRTVGVGTRIFLGGGVGHVAFGGTQHDPSVPRNEGGVPLGGAGTLAVTGDLKGMSHRFLRGVSATGYGVSLAVGIGIPIPILDEEMAAFTAVSDSEISAPVVDYSRDYWSNSGEPLALVTYEELRSGSIEIEGKKVRTGALSSLAKARVIAEELKGWIEAGRFTLAAPVDPIPGAGSGRRTGPLEERPFSPGGPRAAIPGGAR